MDRGLSAGHAGCTSLPPASTPPPSPTPLVRTPGPEQLQFASGVANIASHSDLLPPLCPRLQDDLQFRIQCRQNALGIELKIIEMPQESRGPEIVAYLNELFRLEDDTPDWRSHVGHMRPEHFGGLDIQQYFNLENEILEVMAASGALSLAALESVLQSKPRDESRLYIANAGKPPSPSGTNYPAVIENCSYIEGKLREYSALPAEPSTYLRQECENELVWTLHRAREEHPGEKPDEPRLKQITAGHMLHVVCAAAKRNIGILMESGDPAYLWRAMALARNLSGLPAIYLGATLKELEPKLDLIVERLFDLSCAGGRSPQEATDEARTLLGPIAKKMGGGASARLEARLTTTATTRRAIQELEIRAAEISRLKLAVDVGSGVTVGPDEYRSREHAFAVLEYVRCLSRIDYLTAKEIMPHLAFVAAGASNEPLPHRRTLRDFVYAMSRDLQALGVVHEGKVQAIRAWLATNPFGRC